MPLLSFYFVSEKEHPWLYSVDHMPTDWLELKHLLAEVMAKLHRERGIAEGIIVLYRHLPGRAAPMFTKPYSPSLIPYKREFEAAFKVRYSPRTGEVEVAQASFNYTLNHVRDDFWWMERGIRWRVPSVIPREHRDAMGSVKSLLLEPSGLRYVDYSRTPKGLYSFGKEGQMGPYVQSKKGVYTKMEKRLSLRQNTQEKTT
jgi:transposase